MKIINDKKAFDAYFEVVKQRVKRYKEDMDTITTKVAHLKIARGFHRTSAMGILLRAFRGKDSLNTPGHLLRTVLHTSKAISDLMKCTESYIEHLPPQREITIRHCILSNMRRKLYCDGTFTKAAINPIRVADVIVQ